MAYTNLAFYKFVEIEDPFALRQKLQSWCRQHEVKGTILLANEGINSCLAANEESAQAFVEMMHQDQRFADIDFKKSSSPTQPFNRMLVKIKREIVTMGKPNIAPAHFTGKYVEALELKSWLDSGEEIVLVDTRNTYEVRLGTFQKAINPEIEIFRTFPEWVSENLATKKKAKVVTFCTGGIRCEKATAYMRQEGFDEVYQLQGGILKYFEETARVGGNTHYTGDCFVFDYRVAVDQKLQPAHLDLCYACRSPLSEEDKNSPDFVFEKQCPFCVGKTHAKETKLKQIQQRNNERAYRQKVERSKRMKEFWHKTNKEVLGQDQGKC